ncbi:MAG: hypothetical protein ACTSR2_01620 [Candidatus Hodarchaeales archaeon]
MLLTKLLAGIATAGGVVLSTIASLAVLLFVVPAVLEMHPGEETLMSLIVALPVGFTLLSLLEALGISLPALPVSEVALGSMSLVLVITSYYIADLITSRLA